LVVQNEKLPRCQYEYKSDIPFIRFACPEETRTNGKFCIFHDKDHYAEHEQEATERFKEKVFESISQNKPLECIGCFIPAIDIVNLLSERTFSQPVYFNNATFYGGTSFSGVTFSKEAHFSEATFLGGVYFVAANFSEQAYFSAVTFSKEAYFDLVEFSGQAVFSGATFSKEASIRRATFSRIANFSKATFSEIANFGSVTFKEAFFEGTTFSKQAVFADTTFTEGEAYFKRATFSKEAYFEDAKFEEAKTDFTEAKFLAEVYFRRNEFTCKTVFNYVNFEQPNKVIFDESDLSKVSFAYTDVTRIRFGDGIKWGGKKGYTIIEEEWLKRKATGQKRSEDEDVRLELVLSVYRSLRESYEFRLRYDEAGNFFIREMELKRKYREIKSEIKSKDRFDVKENRGFRRHFTLTGLYYHLARYGESISRPAAIGAIILFLSTLFWVTQSNPILEPQFDPSAESDITSTFVGFAQVGNGTQWLKAFERSFADFLPLLSLGGEIKVGIIDYIIKIVGGALTFGLLLIAFRRKFERKYTR
jgi:uncharacterized protein YjbI with pentapeptide repeats